MARSLRIEYENSFHHVMSRGYLRQTILKDSEDFEYFLSQLTRIYTKYGCIMHAYCLMNNHFHLLLQNPMKNIKDSYQINKAYRNKVQEIKDYASKLKVDLKTQKLVLVHALKTKTSMSYKEISDQLFSGQVKVSTLSQQNKRLRDKAILDKELARLLISVESL